MWWAGLTLGLLGSLHCVGMCGPIALAVPSRPGKINKVISVLLYNSGRILTYAAFGALFGLFGQSFVMAGYQQVLSVVMGALILVFLFFPASSGSGFFLTKPVFSFLSKGKSLFGRLFKSSKTIVVFFIGLLNGFLPCGLVYAAVAGAIATGDITKGSLFMVMFGAGTLPAMAVLAFAGQFFPQSWRNGMRRAVPYFVAFMAILLILRGMNLGIPYVSPAFETAGESCCHKSCH